VSEWRIIEGDCIEAMRDLPDESVQTCITSPPYWGLRDYGVEGQLGLESTPEQYVANMVAVFREVRRLLRDDGTLWLNLGDSYASSPPGNVRGVGETSGLAGAGSEKYRQTLMSGHATKRNTVVAGLKPKDLVGIPWMVALALRADGWYLRADVIWAKPNPMPESVTDRPTKAHEYIFLLSKSPRYFYDADAIREEGDPKQTAHNVRYARPYDNEARIKGGQPGNVNNVGIHSRPGPGGRNKRSVWTVASQPFPGAHFATFPPALIEPCILAGTPPKCCGECGAPWQRVVERKPMVVRPTEKRANWQAEDVHARTQVGGTMVEPPSSRTVGWEASCEHDDDSGCAVVLDPFTGSGTTGMVALRHNRDFVGIELNSEYAEMARNRIRDDAPLLNVGAEAA